MKSSFVSVGAITALDEQPLHAPALSLDPQFDKHELAARDEATPEPSPDLQTQPELASTIFNALGRAYLNRGHLEIGRRYIERGLKLRQDFYGEEHPAVADSLQMRARMARDAGQLESAEVDIRRALGIHTRVAKGTVAVAATLWELAVIQLEKNELAAAERTATEGLEILQALYLDHSDPHVPRLLDIVARIHSFRGEHARAAEIYARILDRVSRKLGKRTPKYAAYVANLGTVEQARGNVEEAEACFLEAIDIYEGVNPWHPNLSGFYVNMARLKRSQGESAYPQARAYYRKSLELNERTWGRDHTHFGYDELSLGSLEFECGNLAEAYQLAEDALRVFRASSPTGTYMASALTIAARICISCFEPERSHVDSPFTQAPLRKAEDFLTEAIPLWRKELGEDSYEYAVARAALARVWFLRGERERAERTLRESHAAMTRLRGSSGKLAAQVGRWLADFDAQPTTLTHAPEQSTTNT
jgi:tetratricopeptide (TPR) repeat protein